VNRRPNSTAIQGSPVLIGSVTVLITIVAVFLSYNANEGLPFIPTYSITANVGNSAGLVRGNEVRLGGARVGTVTKLTAKPHANGAVTAQLKLELDEQIRPLPSDSTFRVRPKSALGLKYVELTRGSSARSFRENAEIPLSSAGAKPVEIDDFFNMFDAPSRVGSRTNLDEFGTAFSGRGEALNRTFADLDPLVRSLRPAMRNLASRRAAFGRFFPALQQAAEEVAPVAEVQASMFVHLDGTFEAMEEVSGPIQETISGGPPALDVATRELPAQRPFLAENEELFRRFRPSFAALAGAAPDMGTAFRVGIPPLHRSPGFNRRLTRTFTTLERFGADDRVPAGLRRLTSTARLAGPPLAYVTPAQTTCNYLGLFFNYFQSALSESDSVGSWLRFYVLPLPQRPDSESGPAAKPANGPPPEPNTPLIEKSLVDGSFLHSNPYPNTAAPGQPRECEAGNETYPGQNRMLLGNEPGSQGPKVEKTRRRVR